MRPDAFRRRLAESYARHLRTGKLPHDMPEGGLEFWRIFLQIAATRTYSANGPLALAYTEIEAWSRLNRSPLAPHHVEIIRALDEAWLTHHYSKAMGEISPRQRLSQPLNVAAFDAVFG